MTTVLEEVKKLCYDLKKSVDEKIVPKEQLLKMVNDAVEKQMTTAKPKDEPRFDVIPEPKSLLRRFEIDGKSDTPANQILKASNAKTNFYGQPVITRNSLGERELQVMDPRLEELQHAADNLALVHACMITAGPSDYKQLAQQDPRAAIKSLKTYRRWENLTEGLKSQLDSTTAGSGDEWVPTGWSSQLTDAITLAHVVAALFRMIPMPTEPFTLPTQTAKPKASIVAEGAAPAQTTLGAGKPTTANKSLSTKIFKYFLDFTDEVVEDSIIAMIPFIREWIVMGLVRGEETMIVNGDATGAHMDSDITLAEAPEKGQDGLRQFGSANTYNTTNPDPFTLQALRNTRALLSVGFRETPGDLVYITSGLGLLNLLQMAEVLTLDKIGAMATVLSGQLGMVDGTPIVISEHVREDLNASGVYDGVTTNLTIIICAHRPSFVRGSRRDPRVESDKEIKTSVSTMVSSMRRGFLDIQDSGTWNNVAIAVNIN